MLCVSLRDGTDISVCALDFLYKPSFYLNHRFVYLLSEMTGSHFRYSYFSFSRLLSLTHTHPPTHTLPHCCPSDKLPGKRLPASGMFISPGNPGLASQCKLSPLSQDLQGHDLLYKNSGVGGGGGAVIRHWF